MAFQVSAGVVVSETDLTAGAQTVSVSDAAFAGPFNWGPALDPQNVDSEDVLVRTFGKPDDDIAAFWFSAQSFLAYSNLLHVVRALADGALNATAAAKALTGTVSAVANSNVFITSSNTFVTADLVTGQTLRISNTDYRVLSTNSDHIVVDSPAVGANVVVSASGLLVKNLDHYTMDFAEGISGYGPWVSKYAGELGNSLKVSVASTANAFSSNGTGTVSITAGSNTVTGDGSTDFISDVQIGDYLTIGGQKLQVSAIASVNSLSTVSAATRNVAASAFSRTWQYASLFDRAPGTSAYVATRSGKNDEIHIVVVDVLGNFSGTPGTVLERFSFMSKAADAKNANGDNNYYATVINRQSQYVWWLDTPGTATTLWGDASQGQTFDGDDQPFTTRLAGGQTDNANISDSNMELAYDVFKDADKIDVSLIVTGPASAALASYIVQNICESRADCVGFVSPGKDDVVNNMGQEVASIAARRAQLPSSSYSFMDSGWKYTNDKYNDVFRWVPLNGDMAGLAARSDTTSDPWFSPAGLTRGNVKNVTKLAWNPRQLDRDDIYKLGINPVVQQQGGGTVLMGDKTLLDRPSAFDRINVRRLFIVLEKTIARVAKTQLFEFNDEFTRSQFRNIVEPYLRDVKARRGVTDYRVICDDSNNTDAVIEQNRFVGDIFVKPSRSINFIQLNFVAVSNGVSFQEVTGAL
jgi:hypothetical protein